MLYPMYAMVLLVLIVALLMGKARFGAVKRKEVQVKYFLYNRGYDIPEKLAKLEQNFSNLFEVPVLFYALCITMLALNIHSPVIEALAWAYVGLRYLHSYIHITYNHVLHRFTAFSISTFLLVGMWSWVVFQLV
ncbi:MAPEG family protein [Neptunicella marina]|uniref:MAPEG family protein n=1 Tax=Neptunicella marina TaxID=2125989 RepID=A0A8J6LVC5_9ALTE|nr:MAPEG family protein [Neptunicella marina]MBC3764499.1 MAPEG family protein [Neptunicella marina]